VGGELTEGLLPGIVTGYTALLARRY
jgi:hypothetical protein